jgi:predicted secreted protein
MAARSGRSLLIKQGTLLSNTTLAGFKTNTVSFSAEGVDITDKLDNGYRTFADFAGTLSFEITGDGVAKDATLRDIYLAGGTGFLITDILLDWDGSELWTCNLWFSSYEETGAHDGAVDFSATLQSSGAWAVAT